MSEATTPFPPKVRALPAEGFAVDPVRSEALRLALQHEARNAYGLNTMGGGKLHSNADVITTAKAFEAFLRNG